MTIIDRSNSDQKYADQEWREYKKIATVWATQMTEEFEVQTLEGDMRGNAGDYLCRGPAGEHWPVKRSIFEATYVPVEQKEMEV